MTRNHEHLLRQAVHDLADEALGPANLAEQAISHGRRIRRRRQAGGALLTVVTLAAIAAPFLWLRPDPGAPFAGPTGPTATAEATPSTSASPDGKTGGGDWRSAPFPLPGGWIMTGATLQVTVKQASYVLDRAGGHYVAIEGYNEVWAPPSGDIVAVRDHDRQDETGLLNLRTDTVQWVRTGQPILTPQWSPDGSRLLLTIASKQTGALSIGIITAADGSFRMYDVDGSRYLCTDWCQFTWQPDGREVSLAQTDPTAPRTESAPHARRGLQLFSADDGRPTRLLPIKGNVSGPTAWSPDGQQVLVAGPQGPAVVEVETGRVAQNFPTKPHFAAQFAHWVADNQLLWLDSQEDAVLTDIDGNELERLPLPTELASLTLSVAPA
ncbi:MAG TPA: hypothetical protein VFX60_19605 [Micromonospora sp.]|nr:hypothetical protein [Micromonospora sp.]